MAVVLSDLMLGAIVSGALGVGVALTGFAFRAIGRLRRLDDRMREQEEAVKALAEQARRLAHQAQGLAEKLDPLRDGLAVANDDYQSLLRTAQETQAKAEASHATIEALVEALADTKKDLLFRGKMYVIEGRHQEAIQVLTEYVKGHPESAEGFFQRGIAHRRLSKEQEQRDASARLALKDMQAAAALSPLAPDDLVEVAEVHLHLKGHAEARRLAAEAIEKHARNQARARRVLADALLGEGEWRLAQAEYARLPLRHPHRAEGIAEAVALGARGLHEPARTRLLDETMRDLEGILRANRSDYGACVGLGHLALLRDAPDAAADAVQWYDRARGINVMDTRAWEGLGKAYREMARVAKGEAERRDALQRSLDAYEAGSKYATPKYLPALQNRIARGLSLLDRHEEAILRARASVAARPEYVQNHQALATALLATGQWSEAVHACEAGLAACPDGPGGRAWLLFLRGVGMVPGGHAPASIQAATQALRTHLQASFKRRPFDPMGWDWAHARERVERETGSMTGEQRRLLDDLFAAMGLAPRAALAGAPVQA